MTAKRIVLAILIAIALLACIVAAMFATVAALAWGASIFGDDRVSTAIVLCVLASLTYDVYGLLRDRQCK